MTKVTSYALPDETFEAFAALMRERVGLVFNERNRYDLEVSINEIITRSKESNLSKLYQELLSSNALDKPPWQSLLQLVTVGETYFWRDNGQCEALRQHILPAIIEAHKEDRRLRIWSAGCSTGEEPYTIAMILCDLLPDHAKWDIRILATDINQHALKVAAAGLYGRRSFRIEGEKPMALHYMRPHTGQTEKLEVLPSLHKMVHFSYLNLIKDQYPSPQNETVDLDLIVCRNVTIYFAHEDVKRVVEGFYNCLHDQGWLMVGHSEPSFFTYERFQSHNFPMAIAYQKSEKQLTERKTNKYGFPFLHYGEKQTESTRSLTNPLPLTEYKQANKKPGLPQNKDTKPVPVHVETRVSDNPSLETRPAINKDEGECEHEECARADELLITGDLKGASQLLALPTVKNCAKATIISGRIAILNNDWSKGMALLQTAIRKAPLATVAHYLLGVAAHSAGDRVMALNAFKKAIYLNRHYPLAHFHLATVYREMNEMQHAQRAANNALRCLTGRDPAARVEPHDRLTVAELRQFLNIFLK